MVVLNFLGMIARYCKDPSLLGSFVVAGVLRARGNPCKLELPCRPCTGVPHKPCEGLGTLLPSKIVFVSFRDSSESTLLLFPISTRRPSSGGPGLPAECPLGSIRAHIGTQMNTQFQSGLRRSEEEGRYSIGLFGFCFDARHGVRHLLWCSWRRAVLKLIASAVCTPATLWRLYLRSAHHG